MPFVIELEDEHGRFEIELNETTYPILFGGQPHEAEALHAIYAIGLQAGGGELLCEDDVIRYIMSATNWNYTKASITLKALGKRGFVPSPTMPADGRRPVGGQTCYLMADFKTAFEKRVFEDESLASDARELLGPDPEGGNSEQFH
jgi:hypothetical protein